MQGKQERQNNGEGGRIFHMQITPEDMQIRPKFSM
jgi:hypothetical protein